MITKRERLISDLRIYLAIVFALLIVGCLFVYSSSSSYAFTMHNNPHHFIKKQLYGIALGLICFFIIQYIPLNVIKKTIPFSFVMSVFFTTLTLFKPFSCHIHGSSRWLRLFGFIFQPSEILKATSLTYFALFLSRKKIRSLIHIVPIILICLAISFILLQQPDFGLTVTLLTTLFIIFFIAHGYVKYIATAILLLIPIIITLIVKYPYRLKRITTFWHPWEYATGSGFQIIQSLIAIGSGGWFGAGISHSKQKLFYLPMQHTDFIFSIIAEETGLIGSLFLLLLFISLLYFGIRIALQLDDEFSRLTLLGYTLLVCLQAIINIAVCVGLIPTKGIGLPFISYGNTALVVNLIMVGLITNLVHRSKVSF